MRRLPVRVLQIGTGNFLRGFADWMIHQANTAGVLEHGVAVMKVTPRPGTVLRDLAEQDGAFHVTLDGVRDGQPFTEITRVDVVRETVDAYADWDRCRELACGPELRLVISNTTEAGIVSVDDDLTASPPDTFPAKMAVLLHERWRHYGGDPARGLSFLPCELNEDNGRALREAVLRHATSLDPRFAGWVAEHCRFYDTIVDRIVPGPADVPGDRLAVRGEHYARWAIAGDPSIRAEFPLDAAGLPVEFLDDIRPFRQKKVRVLNGSHTALAAVGPLLGCTTVAEAVGCPPAADYLRRLLDDEVLPTLPADAADFAAATLERFTNPALEHRLADISLNAIAKWHARNLPVLTDRWQAGGAAPLTVFALAVLLTGYAGALGTYPVRDESELTERVRDGFSPTDPQGWLTTLLPSLPGAVSGATERLAAETAQHVRAILDAGAAGALEKVTRNA